MVRTQSEVRHLNATPNKSLASPSLNRRNERRESALHSISRTLTGVFNRAVGRPSEVADETRDAETSLVEPSELNNTSFVTTDRAVVPPQPSVDISMSRRPSIDFSLLRKQSDLRLPAHLIVEAYREALKSRSRQPSLASVTQGNQIRPAEDSRREVRIPADFTTPKTAASKRRFQSKQRGSRVSKARPKPLKHRIQLVTRPIIDIKALPSDRKHRPGFISANFDQDDDSESEAETPEPTIPESAQDTLLRRPQVASTKLKQKVETAVKSQTDESNSKISTLTETPLFSFDRQQDQPAKDQNVISVEPSQPVSTDMKPSPSGEPPVISGQESLSNGSINSTSSASKPLFSFGSGSNEPQTRVAPATSALKDAPKFSFNIKPATESQETSKVDSTPKFTFGSANFGKADNASGSAAAKDNTAGTTLSNGLSSSDTKLSEPKETAKRPAEEGTDAVTNSNKRPFTFSLSSQTDSEKKSSVPISFGDSANKPAFSFGSVKSSDGSANQQESGKATPSAPEASKPVFSFGSSKPAASLDFSQDGSEKKESSIFAASENNKPMSFNFAFNKTSSPAPSAPSAPSVAAVDDNANTNTPVSGGGNIFQQGKPSFSFGATTDTKALSGQSSTAPKANESHFDFGSSARKNSENTAAPFTFTFGASKEDTNASGESRATPQPVFGSSELASSKPSVNTGSLFGTSQSTPKDSDTNKGQTGFSFGKSASLPPPQTSATTAQAPFAFGSTTKHSTPQAFVFGSSDNNNTSTQSAFAFNNKGSASTTPSAPTFTFGQPTQTNTTAPMFGASPAPGFPAATNLPASNFPFGNTGTQPQFGQFGSSEPFRDTTPGANNPPPPGNPIAGRKILQVKKRLNRK